MTELHGGFADLTRLVSTYGTLTQPELDVTEPTAGTQIVDDLGWDFGRIEVENPKQSAVLILFGALDNTPAEYGDTVVPEDLDVLLTQRALSLRNHPGQVSFPGGKMDPEDRNFTDCALREAQEETGLAPSTVQVIGELAEVPLSVSNFQVVPVVAWWKRPTPVAVIDAHEATRVFRAPVADLVNPANRVTTVHYRRGSGHHRSGAGFQAPGFIVADTLVWGFTAILLDRILQLTGWSQDWDKNRHLDVTGWDATQPIPPIYQAKTA